MTRPIVAFLSTALLGCAAQPDSGPDPADPFVYDASPETKAVVGIAKWGFSVDAADGASVFHGYNERNTRVVEIRQSFDITDLLTKHFAVRMTGSAATGSERIDYVVQSNDDGSDVSYAQNVIQNTFAPGSIGERILTRLAPDATAVASNDVAAATGTALLSQSVRPLTTSLISEEPTELVTCCAELTRATAAASAGAIGVCLLERKNMSLIGSGTSSPQDVQLAPGGGLAPRALVIGPGNAPTIVSPWTGNFNIVDHHCHNAAAANSSSIDGYIGCAAGSATTTYAGHTINWAPDPAKDGAAGAFCAYDPQSNGGTPSSNSVCCWQDGTGAGGAPLLSSPQAQACVTQLCVGQADFTGGSPPPMAFPPGSTPPVPTDCPSSTGAIEACIACCRSLANSVATSFPISKYTQQIRSYRLRCATACVDRNQAQNTTGCLGKALAGERSTTEAGAQCAIAIPP